MEVIFTIQYYKKVLTVDIPKLSREDKKKIQRSIEEKLTTQPHVFSEHLRHSLRGYRKLRVGDYRVIFHIEGIAVIIFCIEHRSIIYREIHKRL